MTVVREAYHSDKSLAGLRMLINSVVRDMAFLLPSRIASVLARGQIESHGTSIFILHRVSQSLVRDSATLSYVLSPLSMATYVSQASQVNDPATAIILLGINSPNAAFKGYWRCHSG